MVVEPRLRDTLGRTARTIPRYLLRPVNLFKTYDRANLRPDIMAGITVAVILLPQAIAFALIAELPPQVGLYAAIVGAVIGGLWGSSNQAHTGPTNAISLLVLSALLVGFTPGTPEFLVAASLMAVMVGAFQLVMGLARLGVLINFVSHSVIVGFATGAGLLIALRQIKPLLGLDFESESLWELLEGLARHIGEINVPTAILGVGAMLLIIGLRRINRRLPAALLAMILSSAAVFVFNLIGQGVAVIGELPSAIPPLASLPLLDLTFISRLSTGALAVGAIGLVETMAISRSIATQTGQRLDSNQEFVGQGLANIVVGLFSGYPVAGSFSRTAVNFNAGARTPVAALFSSGFVLAAALALAPLAAYLPRAALAGVLIVVAIGMINLHEIGRIWQGAPGDAIIMLVTFLATLFVEISFAVLFGILLSFALYIVRTSTPRVHYVVPDETFTHFVYQPDRPVCVQLGVIDILGDLYFGAVNHVEETILHYLDQRPDQRFLLLRMQTVNNCDFSGIHMLENVVRLCRDRGGDVYMVRVSYRVDRLMKSTGFCDYLGEGNFLSDDEAITFLFHHALDPAICIYECPVRVFRECQNLPKQIFPEEIQVLGPGAPRRPVAEITPQALWAALRSEDKNLTVVDVREPREFHESHVPGAELVPLPRLLSGEHKIEIGGGHRVVFVCRSGRRSRLAAQRLMSDGQENVEILMGGILAWENAGMLEAVDR
jgi:sulfate permease, SulP family